MSHSQVRLPIEAFRDQILASVDAAQVTIIVAETGAGKSTQVPQYLAEHGYLKIIVTQPRILAARNLSIRVREEWLAKRSEDVVGYRTAHERDDNNTTRILYCTDGLQLVREVTGDGTKSMQVLVLDEIHEWNQNMEVLVAWAKKRCQEEARFKVVVMSATIDAMRLAEYFGAGTPITVPGRTFPIAMLRGVDLLEELQQRLQAEPRNVLVFLPGKSEIERVAWQIAAEAEQREIPIIPLHSQLSPEQQQQAFAHFEQGKIVLSTNIAQTSVTIDDIDTVIDSGLERRTEILNGVEGLFIGQVSRADCLQRAGRAGRTKAGDYVLAPLDRLPCLAVDERSPYAVPEILRTHLDRLVLRLANVGIDIGELEFFHAPAPHAVEDAKKTLVTLGAMTKKGVITEIGRRMERFPVESRYARMLVEAENLPEDSRRKLAAVIAIQEVGGIVRGGSRSLGWLQYTDQAKSDLLAQYELFIALPGIDPELFEDLGIIAKSVIKADETYSRLVDELGLSEGALSVLEPYEANELMRCIVSGQIDQLWIMHAPPAVSHFLGGKKRELSGGTVVSRAGLISGTPFDLEVPTPKGLEILHLVQNVTAVDPRWLEAAAPETFKAMPGEIYFDSTWGSLARNWPLLYSGKLIKGASVPVLEATPENKRLFGELFSLWMFERLEEDRRLIQKETGKRIPSVSLRRVQERIRGFTAGMVLLDRLTHQQRLSLSKLASMRSYLGKEQLDRPAAVKRKILRNKSSKHPRRLVRKNAISN